jgi:hypothetical protein
VNGPAPTTPPQSGEPASPPAEGQQPPAQGEPNADGTQQTPTTVEETEKLWQHRVSQKDKAHAAAEQALRDENDALKRQLGALSQPRPQSNGQSGTQGNGAAVNAEAEALRQQLADNQRALEDEKKQRTLDARRAKYPSLAKNVGDAGIDIFNTSDEATLARLNAQLDDGSSGTGTFAPTSPRRAAPAPAKQLGEMSKVEIEDQLRRSVERGDLKREQR